MNNKDRPMSNIDEKKLNQQLIDEYEANYYGELALLSDHYDKDVEVLMSY